MVRSTCRKCVRVARPRRKLSFSLRGVHFLNTVPLEPRLANGRTGSRAQRRGAPIAHYGKSAPLLAKSLTFVSEVQPSHTYGMSIAPLSSRLLTFPQNLYPSLLKRQFTKRANGVRVSDVRLQSVIGVSFSGSLHLARLPVPTASGRPPLSHFGVSPRSLSRR